MKYRQFMFCDPPANKKRIEDFLSFFVGLRGGAEEDTYLNFMTENCQFYSHKIALIA